MRGCLIGSSAACSRCMIRFGLLFVLTCTSVESAEALRVDIGAFSRGRLDAEWQPKSFKNGTDYRLEQIDGRLALHASSRAAASGLYREIIVDLNRTPFLYWSWRVDRTPDVRNEQAKSGDDYAARIYVVISGGLAFWRARSLNYVWASTTAQGSRWANPFAGPAVQMLALRSGNRDIGQWLHERRNVKRDLQEAFGEVIDRIDGVALMTDTDNSNTQAEAYYGDIHFSSQ